MCSPAETVKGIEMRGAKTVIRSWPVKEDERSYTESGLCRGDE